MADKPTWGPEAWVPIRNGKFYCSPACGGGTYCTWAAYQKAEKDAKALAKRLGKWKPRVWENLGWHWEVNSPCGRISVNRRSKQYSVEIRIEDDKHIRQWFAYAATPEKAIALARSQVQAHIAELQSVIETLKEI